MNTIEQEKFKDTIFEPLLHIPDCPKKLYYRGSYDITNTNNQMITIVGSRMCSNYSKSVVSSLIKKLSPYPVCIVSGLALGIDSCAHKQSLDSEISTISFPGSGLADQAIYPASHKNLANTIAEHGGLLVSEFSPETKAARWTFPKRNRIMAGISDLLIVIEAQEKSGTLITARLGLEYNKTIAVIPHPIDSVHALGSNKLMQEGAYPILSYKDILHLLDIPIDEKTRQGTRLTQDEHVLFELLSTPLSKNTLYERSDFSYTKFIQILSTLELKGVIIERAGTLRRT